MDKKKINRIIDFIREEMMTTGNTPGNQGLVVRPMRKVLLPDSIRS